MVVVRVKKVRTLSSRLTMVAMGSARKSATEALAQTRNRKETERKPK